MSVVVAVWRTVASPIGLLILLIAYSFVGAAIFRAVEGPHESHEKHDLLEMRQDIIDDLWNSSSHGGLKNRAAFAHVVASELKRYEAQLYSAYAAGINTEADDPVWDFWGAMVYVATIYTTIGYGHICPVTDTGRIITMIYATIGIPLCLILLAEWGKLLTFIIKALYCYPRRMMTSCKAGDPNDYPVNEEFNLPISVAVAITLVYMFGGAFMYQFWEDWSYLEGVYFIFISISTVGFGDVLPGNPKYFLLSFAYQLFGLALGAMVLNVIMEALQVHVTHIGNSVVDTGRSVGVELGKEEDKAKTE